MRKSILERRIERLEKALSSRNKRRKFESYEEASDLDGALKKADEMIKEFSSLTGLTGFRLLEENGFWWSDEIGEMGEEDFEEEKHNGAYYAVTYNNGEYTAIMNPSSNTVVVLNGDGNAIDPHGNETYDDIEKWPIAEWAAFRKSSESKCRKPRRRRI